MTPGPTALSFADAARLAPLAPGRWRARLDASWGQGRALFGGIQATLLVRACEPLVGDDARHLRTLAVAFCRAAEPGELDVEARVERAGRYVTHLSARLVQGGETVATALAAFARDRDDALRVAATTPPSLPPPESLPPLPASPVIPVFTRHFDLRFVPGTAPFSGGADPVAEGWVRFAAPTPPDAGAMAALLDVWPPAVLAVLRQPRPSASVDLRYDVLQPLPLAGARDDDVYAFRCRVLDWASGHGIDEGELWTRDGRLVARIRQLRVVF